VKVRAVLMHGVLAALLAGSVGAAQEDLKTLLQLLRRAERFDVRGEVHSSVFFPPRAEPTKTLKTLPRVEFVPWLVVKNFNLNAVGREVIAGRDAVRYELVPKVGNAAHWSLWLDSAWNVPLAYEERNPDGSVARRAAFTRVDGEPRLKLRVLAARVNEPGFRKAVLTALPGLKFPSGFEPVEYRLVPQGRQVTLSDGVNVLSLVIADRGVREGNGVAARRVGGVFLWLTGNLPQGALREALAGVRNVRVGALGTFVPQDDSKE